MTTYIRKQRFFVGRLAKRGKRQYYGTFYDNLKTLER